MASAKPTDFGEGIFRMDFITIISNDKISPLAVLKQAAVNCATMSTANSKNKAAAFAMIEKAKDSKALVLGMSNFSLAHQGLKTL